MGWSEEIETWIWKTLKGRHTRLSQWQTNSREEGWWGLGVAKTIALSPTKQPQACLNSVLKVANIPVDSFGEWQAVLKQPLYNVNIHRLQNIIIIYKNHKITLTNNHPPTCKHFIQQSSCMQMIPLRNDSVFFFCRAFRGKFPLETVCVKHSLNFVLYNII